MRGVAVACALFLSAVGLSQSLPKLGEEIGKIGGYVAAGLPFRNPCGPDGGQPMVLALAYLNEEYNSRQDQKKRWGWQYAVQLTLFPGDAFNCDAIGEVQYFIATGARTIAPPLTFSFYATGSQYAAVFIDIVDIRPARMVAREGEIKPEVMFRVPRFITMDHVLCHQGVAFVYDVEGNLMMILTTNRISIDIPGTAFPH
jgi:hypothetical protein